MSMAAACYDTIPKVLYAEPLGMDVSTLYTIVCGPYNNLLNIAKSTFEKIVNQLVSEGTVEENMCKHFCLTDRGRNSVLSTRLDEDAVRISNKKLSLTECNKYRSVDTQKYIYDILSERLVETHAEIVRYINSRSDYKISTGYITNALTTLTSIGSIVKYRQGIYTLASTDTNSDAFKDKVKAIYNERVAKRFKTEASRKKEGTHKSAETSGNVADTQMRDVKDICKGFIEYLDKCTSETININALSKEQRADYIKFLDSIESLRKELNNSLLDLSDIGTKADTRLNETDRVKQVVEAVEIPETPEIKSTY